MTERGRSLLRSLTPMEKRMVVLVCAALPYEAIAARMGTQEQVVKNQMSKILKKARLHNRAELIVLAFRDGVVECPCSRRQAAPHGLQNSQCRE